MTAFDPSPARRGLDLLLQRHPQLDLVSARIPGRDPHDPMTPWVSSSWLLVGLGQPSEGDAEAYAIWSFAIWRSTGAVFAIGPDGAVGDEPLLELQDAPSFTCPVCGRTSWNPIDARERYCGACHGFTETPPAGFAWVLFVGGPLDRTGQLVRLAMLEPGCVYDRAIDGAEGRYVYDGESFHAVGGP
jgi:hypothetical protein